MVVFNTEKPSSVYLRRLFLITFVPNVPNLLVFAAPMMILYALSIGIAWVFYRKREAEAH
ncbi:MAG TPA: hypothetical protein VNO70_04135 [Blastocatellia bacterium]|nr:hypothetical protein [Blastocatellia bacterium]